MKMTIFCTYPYLSFLHSHKIVHRRKNEVVINIASYKRMNELLYFSGMSGCSHNKDGKVFICYAKISLCNTTGKVVNGYAFDEGKDSLEIWVEGKGRDEIIIVERSK